ncbi:unnamed protein product [Parajaminaea phylloscopi]
MGILFNSAAYAHARIATAKMKRVMWPIDASLDPVWLSGPTPTGHLSSGTTEEQWAATQQQLWPGMRPSLQQRSALWPGLLSDPLTGSNEGSRKAMQPNTSVEGDDILDLMQLTIDELASTDDEDGSGSGADSRAPTPTVTAIQAPTFHGRP